MLLDLPDGSQHLVPVAILALVDEHPVTHLVAGDTVPFGLIAAVAHLDAQVGLVLVQSLSERVRDHTLRLLGVLVVWSVVTRTPRLGLDFVVGLVVQHFLQQGEVPLFVS